MRIHGLCLVKNEADIVRQGLQAARKWCDAIYVYDNGSTDGTWEQVQAIACHDPAIVPWKQDTMSYRNGLRAGIYHAFADRAQPGDWWVRLDPDEFYVDDPVAFLSRVPASAGYVWHAALNYYFSTEEARRYREDPSQFADDVPITEKCRHYFSYWSEVRFVRTEAMAPWEGTKGWPENLERLWRSYHRRILCRHFPYRSPVQIERRLATRAAGMFAGTGFRHEAMKNWRATHDPLAIQRHRWKREELRYVSGPDQMEWGWESRVIDASHLVFDAHDGHFVVNEDLMPEIPGVRRPLIKRLVVNRFTRAIMHRLRTEMEGRGSLRTRSDPERT
jgi:glycosyltransferase involved in cell wall biosynthesis